jgi:hypothetical protein
MQIRISLTEDIVNQSLGLHYRFAPARQKYSILLVPAILMILAVSLITKEFAKPVFGQNGWLGILYIAISIGYYFWMRYRREHTGKQLIRGLGNNATFEMVANDDELITHLSDTTFKHEWPAFIKAIISTDLVLLYQQNQSFSMFHHSFFANGDFTGFKQLVRRYVNAVIEV